MVDELEYHIEVESLERYQGNTIFLKVYLHDNAYHEYTSIRRAIAFLPKWLARQFPPDTVEIILILPLSLVQEPPSESVDVLPNFCKPCLHGCTSMKVLENCIEEFIERNNGK